MRKEQRISLFLVLAMLLQIILPVFDGQAFAEENSEDRIVKNLKILGTEKEFYNPGDIISLGGDWSLADDCDEKTYVAGDSFTISVPKGLTPKFDQTDLGKYGKGVYDEANRTFTFTFTEEVEGRLNRHGGFNLHFIVDKQEGDDPVPIDLTFKDEKGNPLLKKGNKS